jgi:hypothetical protein
VLSGRGLYDELITRPEESYRLCCVVVCDLETSRKWAPYVYDIRSLRVKLTDSSLSHKGRFLTKRNRVEISTSSSKWKPLSSLWFPIRQSPYSLCI